MKTSKYPADLSLVKQNFDNWRANKGEPKQIPDSLWEQALSLLSKYKSSLVGSALGLSGGQIKNRLEKACPSGALA